MNCRDPRWLQGGLDALKATLDVGNATKQEMIDFLLDEGLWNKKQLSAAAARSRFNACLNPEKKEYFKTSEIVALMMQFQQYEFYYWMSDVLGFERPVKIPVSKRQADLLDEMEADERAHQERQTARREELSRLNGLDPEPPAPRQSSDVLRIHPRFREPGSAFSRDEDGEGGW